MFLSSPCLTCTPESGLTGKRSRSVDIFNESLEFSVIFWNIIKFVLDSCCTRRCILTICQINTFFISWQCCGSLKRRSWSDWSVASTYGFGHTVSMDTEHHCGIWLTASFRLCWILNWNMSTNIASCDLHASGGPRLSENVFEDKWLLN